MVLYCSLTAVCVLLGYFINSDFRSSIVKKTNTNLCVQEQLNRVLAFSIFLLLFLVSALRIGTGNDYWVYRNNFLLVAGGDTKVSYEIGFRLLIKASQWLGGLDNFVLIFGVSAFITCAFFVKGLYDNSDWFVFTVFLFMTNGFYFMSFSNVRYYMAIAITIYSMKYLFREKYAAFIIWICVAALFHKTVLLVIPVYLVAYLLNWNRKTIWLLPVAIAGLCIGEPIIGWLVYKIYPYYTEAWGYSVASISYVNIIKCLAILVLSLIYYKTAIKGDKKAEFLFNLNLLALLLYSFGSYLPEISRICYYMVIGQIFLIPIVIKKIPDKKQKLFFTIAIVIAYILYFAMFLYKGTKSGVNILPYLCWLFD